MSGTLADDLWNMTKLMIKTNRLSGTIPNLPNLMIEEVDLHMNYFTGTIPASICQWNLTDIIAFENQFTGPLLPSDCTTMIQKGDSIT